MLPFKIEKTLKCDNCRLKYPRCVDCDGDTSHIYFFKFLDSKNKCVTNKILFIEKSKM